MAILQTLRSGGTEHPEEIASFLDARLISQSGVVSMSDDHFLCAEETVPAMSVKVTEGYAYLITDDGSMAYPQWLHTGDGSVSITSNATGNPRIDTIILYQDLSTTPNATVTNVAKLYAVEGIAAASPSVPTDAEISAEIGASNPFLRLANVTISSGATSILNADITDKRSQLVIKEEFMPKDGVQRQLIGNGNFDIWQRGITFTNLLNGYFTADRWFIGRTDDGAVDIVKSGLVPTIAESGSQSRNSLQATVTTADTTIDAGQYYMIQQIIEGYNSSLYGFGKSDPGFFTFSFWVRATKTGIYCVSFRNESVDRSYVSEYTVNTSDTWEKKTITIPVDDTGTWSETTGKGLRLAFTLASGTNLHGTADTWTADNLLATSNQVNALDTIGNTFNIAQVQINSGSVALPFQRKSISEEFAECQRHFEESNFYSSEPASFFQYRSTSTLSGIVNYNVRKMVIPTVTISSFAKTNNKVSGETSPTDHTATSCTVRSQNSTVSGFGVITSTSTSFGSGGRYWFRWKAETGF